MENIKNTDQHTIPLTAELSRLVKLKYELFSVSQLGST